MTVVLKRTIRLSLFLVLFFSFMVTNGKEADSTKIKKDKSLSLENNIASLTEALDADNLSKKEAEEDALDELEDDEENAEEPETGKDKARRDSKPDKGPKIWDQWSKWSACSVTCGIGKITRWRHCVSGGCSSGEKEAQIKTCTLAAC